MSAGRQARLLVLALLAVMIGLLIVWQHPQLASRQFAALLWIAPLLLPAPGLVRGKRYTYAWSTLIAIGYIGLALTEVIAGTPARAVAAAMLFTAFALFIALVLYLRATRARP